MCNCLMGIVFPALSFLMDVMLLKFWELIEMWTNDLNDLMRMTCNSVVCLMLEVIIEVVARLVV